jgi:hypothetical protein
MQLIFAAMLAQLPPATCEPQHGVITPEVCWSVEDGPSWTPAIHRAMDACADHVPNTLDRGGCVIEFGKQRYRCEQTIDNCRANWLRGCGAYCTFLEFAPMIDGLVLWEHDTCPRPISGGGSNSTIIEGLTIQQYRGRVATATVGSGVVMRESVRAELRNTIIKGFGAHGVDVTCGGAISKYCNNDGYVIHNVDIVESGLDGFFAPHLSAEQTKIGNKIRGARYAVTYEHNCYLAQPGQDCAAIHDSADSGSIDDASQVHATRNKDGAAFPSAIIDGGASGDPILIRGLHAEDGAPSICRGSNRVEGGIGPWVAAATCSIRSERALDAAADKDGKGVIFRTDGTRKLRFGPHGVQKVWRAHGPLDTPANRNESSALPLYTRWEDEWPAEEACVVWIKYASGWRCIVGGE